MAKKELIGLQKYFKSEDPMFVEGAISMLNCAKRYKERVLTSRTWNSLKELICDPNIKDVMDLINKTYKEFLLMAKQGKVSKEEQLIVKTQVDDCNTMLKDAIKELELEGRITFNAEKTNSIYKIKLSEKEESAELILK